MTDIFSQFGTNYTSPVIANKKAEAVPVAEVSVNNAVPAQNIISQKDDEFVSEKKEKENNNPKGPFGFFRKIVSNVKKSLVDISEYSKGIFNGIKDATILGSITFTGITLKHAISQRSIRKAAEKAQEIVPAATKSKLAIPLAIGVAALTMAKNIWNASLSANKKKSDIHHTYIGH